jgi:uncharacterized protein YneF (UPF0154 family)
MIKKMYANMTSRVDAARVIVHHFNRKILQPSLGWSSVRRMEEELITSILLQMGSWVSNATVTGVYTILHEQNVAVPAAGTL